MLFRIPFMNFFINSSMIIWVFLQKFLWSSPINFSRVFFKETVGYFQTNVYCFFFSKTSKFNLDFLQEITQNISQNISLKNLA